MTVRLGVNVPGVGKLHAINGESLSFTLPGLKRWLNEVEVRAGYSEGTYGPEVELPIGLVLMYAKDATVEVATV